MPCVLNEKNASNRINENKCLMLIKTCHGSLQAAGFIHQTPK